jgi:hypothetical protein
MERFVNDGIGFSLVAKVRAFSFDHLGFQALSCHRDIAISSSKDKTVLTFSSYFVAGFLGAAFFFACFCHFTKLGKLIGKPSLAYWFVYINLPSEL